MRRREKAEPGAKPLTLQVYRREDWIGVGCHPECAFWEAVEAWREEHPEQGSIVTDGPDVPWHEEWGA